MRLSLMGMMVATLLAAPAVAAPAGPVPADARAGLSQVAVAPSSTSAGPQQRLAQVQYYVDLNSASRKELMTLPGIGAEEAGGIIAHRPYLTKTDLVTRNVLPIGPFLSIKPLVVALPASVSKGRH